MNGLKTVLLVEDDPNDVERALDAIRRIGYFWAVLNERPPLRDFPASDRNEPPA